MFVHWKWSKISQDCFNNQHKIISRVWRFLVIDICYHVAHFFFSIWVLFHEHSRITGLQGKGEGISLTPRYHFHLLHRHLDISRVIAAGTSPLHIASSRTWTGNRWFPALTTKLRSLLVAFSQKTLLLVHEKKIWQIYGYLFIVFMGIYSLLPITPPNSLSPDRFVISLRTCSSGISFSVDSPFWYFFWR